METCEISIPKKKPEIEVESLQTGSERAIVPPISTPKPLSKKVKYFIGICGVLVVVSVSLAIALSVYFTLPKNYLKPIERGSFQYEDNHYDIHQYELKTEKQSKPYKLIFTAQVYTDAQKRLLQETNQPTTPRSCMSIDSPGSVVNIHFCNDKPPTPSFGDDDLVEMFSSAAAEEEKNSGGRLLDEAVSTDDFDHLFNQMTQGSEGVKFNYEPLIEKSLTELNYEKKPMTSDIIPLSNFKSNDDSSSKDDAKRILRFRAKSIASAVSNAVKQSAKAASTAIVQTASIIADHGTEIGAAIGAIVGCVATIEEGCFAGAWAGLRIGAE